MAIVLGPNRYGKAQNRIVRIERDAARHEIHDLNVSTALRGDFGAAHLHGDQAQVLPTDSQPTRTRRTTRSSGSSRTGWRSPRTSSTTSRP
jgi:urate oxidase